MNRDVTEGDGTGPEAGPAPVRRGDGDPSQGRVDLRRVLTGLRHLSAAAEPVRVFTELAAVCVPALCDECLIQIVEHGRRPYRIRRTWPDMTGTRPSLTDEAFIVVTQGRGTPLDGCRTGGAVVETTERDVLARFTNPLGGGPDYHGVLVCRWAGGHAADASDAALVGVLTEHAVALVHRERTTGTVDDPRRGPEHRVRSDRRPAGGRRIRHPDRPAPPDPSPGPAAAASGQRAHPSSGPGHR